MIHAWLRGFAAASEECCVFFFAQHGLDGFKSRSMLGTGSQTLQSIEVLSRAVAGMFGKAVSRPLLMEFSHPMVSSRFREYGCGRNSRHFVISLHNGVGHAGQMGRPAIAVDQNIFRRHAPAAALECRHRTLHGEIGGIENIHAVNLFHRGPADAPGQRAFANDGRQCFSLFGRKLL